MPHPAYPDDPWRGLEPDPDEIRARVTLSPVPPGKEITRESEMLKLRV